MPPHPRRPAAPWSRRLAVLAMLLALSPSAGAHVTWENGRPVPDWVTKACCGPSDAHHLRADQVRRVADGYRIDGYPGTIYDVEVLPSEDGEYWAFYKEVPQASGDRIVTSVFCFFAPSWG